MSTSSVPCVLVCPRPRKCSPVFVLVLEWAHRRGVHLLRYLDDWLVIAESRILLQHRDLVLQLCRDLGTVVNWEKSDLQFIHSCPVSGDADRHISREGVPVKSSPGSLSGNGNFFSASSVASSAHVAAVVGPHDFTGAFSSLRLLTRFRCIGASMATSSPWWMTLSFRSLRRRSVWRRFIGGSRRAGASSVSLTVSSSIPVAAYWCISDGLQIPPVKFDSFEGVVPRREFVARQHAGDGSHCSGSNCFSAPVVGSGCCPNERQRHGCHLPPASGRHSVLCPIVVWSPK